MVAEWPTKSIDEIKAPQRGAIAIGPFGSRMKSENYVKSGVPVIRGTNIGDTRQFVGEMVYITNDFADNLGNAVVRAGDLVFPHRGSIGEVGIVPNDNNPRYVLSTSLMKLTCDLKLVDPIFLFYFFRSNNGRHELLKNASTVGTPGIGQPLSSLRKIRFCCPPLSEQKSIARILGTLDDKIELNRRMSATLEASVRALFRSWFVDFDPVRAKGIGQQLSGIDAVTAALFPSSFQKSELGEIPVGWNVRTIGETIELAYGKPLKEENRKGGLVAVYGSNGQVGWHDERLVCGPGIVVGRKGNPGVITWAHGDFYPIDTTFYVVPIADCRSLHFLYHALDQQDLQNLGADSAVPGLNRNQAYLSKILIPPPQVLRAFDEQVARLYSKINANKEESLTLASLRDALLQKLLIGEFSSLCTSKSPQ